MVRQQRDRGLLRARVVCVLCSLVVAAGAVAACGGDDSGGAGGSGPEAGAGGGTPAAVAVDTFAGEWQSTFGRLRLTAAGDRLRGNYDFCAGRLSGRVVGNRLEGTWQEDTSACDDPESAARPVAEGTFSFTLDAGGDAFTGFYETTGSPERNAWNATRVSGG